MILTPLHYLYIIIVIIILAIMLMKKEIVVPCVIGIFAMGLVSSGNIITAVRSIFNAIIYAGTEFWGIIAIISLVVAMSKALQDIGSDVLMMSPIKKIMVNNTLAFFGIGFTMMIISWLVWPSPAVPLVGAVLLPAAIKKGLSPLYAAVAMNIFGHGIALSSDFFIQGAPSITAKGAGVEVSEIMSASVPLWLTMSLVTVIVAFTMMKRDMKKHPYVNAEVKVNNLETNTEKAKTKSKKAILIAIITPVAFIIDIIAMLKLKLAGGDATALVGGTAVLLMFIATFANFKFKESKDKISSLF